MFYFFHLNLLIPGKLSGSKSNLASLKSKFGSCLGLKSAVDKEAENNQLPYDIGTEKNHNIS
jgi:hypothetical protein